MTTLKSAAATHSQSISHACKNLWVIFEVEVAKKKNWRSNIHASDKNESRPPKWLFSLFRYLYRIYWSIHLKWRHSLFSNRPRYLSVYKLFYKSLLALFSKHLEVQWQANLSYLSSCLQQNVHSRSKTILTSSFVLGSISFLIDFLIRLQYLLVYSAHQWDLSSPPPPIGH